MRRLHPRMDLHTLGCCGKVQMRALAGNFGRHAVTDAKVPYMQEQDVRKRTAISAARVPLTRARLIAFRIASDSIANRLILSVCGDGAYREIATLIWGHVLRIPTAAPDARQLLSSRLSMQACRSRTLSSQNWLAKAPRKTRSNFRGGRSLWSARSLHNARRAIR